MALRQKCERYHARWPLAPTRPHATLSTASLTGQKRIRILPVEKPISRPFSSDIPAWLTDYALSPLFCPAICGTHHTSLIDRRVALASARTGIVSTQLPSVAGGNIKSPCIAEKRSRLSSEQDQTAAHGIEDESVTEPGRRYRAGGLNLCRLSAVQRIRPQIIPGWVVLTAKQEDLPSRLIVGDSSVETRRWRCCPLGNWE